MSAPVNHGGEHDFIWHLPRPVVPDAPPPLPEDLRERVENILASLHQPPATDAAAMVESLARELAAARADRDEAREAGASVTASLDDDCMTMGLPPDRRALVMIEPCSGLFHERVDRG